VSVEPWTGSNTSHLPQNRYHPVLATFSSEDGYIRYWQCNLDKKTDMQSQTAEKIWAEEVKFFVGEEPKIIKCGPQGKIAVESILDFTEEAANFLSEQLKVISLPELTSVEQAQLLALVDTLIQRQQMEIIARNHYMQKEERDPTDCSLFYMALRKKKLLLGLWRTANNHREQAVMLKFLSNNFDEPRWKTAALKNAYALLGKQRYGMYNFEKICHLLMNDKIKSNFIEYAAAFFLLGDKLKDAANVCLKYLDDFQLAIAICRVYE
ncbi:2277_t:CDS:2, partial [Racocetra fulgida]